MGLRVRVGPLSVGTNGRVGVNAGPVSYYTGGRPRSSSSSWSALGMALGVAILLAIVAAPFVVPACVIGHWFGVMPSMGQFWHVAFDSGDTLSTTPYTGKWLSHHYPDIFLRFVLVDLVFALALVSARRLYRGIRVEKVDAVKNAGARSVVTNTATTNSTAAATTGQPEWMVRYDCVDGTRILSNARYQSHSAAEKTASKTRFVTLGEERREVAAWMVALDPKRDDELPKRKRAKARDAHRSHAYCLNCHRRIYSGDTDCMCGVHRRTDWETEFEKKHGIKPETAPAGTMRLSPVPVGQQA